MTTNTSALTEADIQTRLANKLNSWKYHKNALQRIYTCETYLQSLDLLYQIGRMSEQNDHHPDLILNYKRLTIRYWTHSTNGVTELDFEGAQQAESLIQQK